MENGIPVLGSYYLVWMRKKNGGSIVFWLFIKTDLCSAISFKWAWRELPLIRLNIGLS